MLHRKRNRIKDGMLIKGTRILEHSRKSYCSILAVLQILKFKDPHKTRSTHSAKSKAIEYIQTYFHVL